MIAEQKKQKQEALSFVRSQIQNAPQDDNSLLSLIKLGDTIRAGMAADVEVEYTETQKLAIQCSSYYEIATDPAVDDFDFESADREIEELLGDDE